jgi:hypothetical protein
MHSPAGRRTVNADRSENAGQIQFRLQISEAAGGDLETSVSGQVFALLTIANDAPALISVGRECPTLNPRGMSGDSQSEKDPNVRKYPNDVNGENDRTAQRRPRAGKATTTVIQISRHVIRSRGSVIVPVRALAATVFGLAR